MKNYWVFYVIRNFFFSCVCIKQLKSGKKDIKKCEVEIIDKGNDLVEKIIKSCRKSSKGSLEFKKTP